MLAYVSDVIVLDVQTENRGGGVLERNDFTRMLVTSNKYVLSCQLFTAKALQYQPTE